MSDTLASVLSYKINYAILEEEQYCYAAKLNHNYRVMFELIPTEYNINHISYLCMIDINYIPQYNTFSTILYKYITNSETIDNEVSDPNIFTSIKKALDSSIQYNSYSDFKLGKCVTLIF